MNIMHFLRNLVLSTDGDDVQAESPPPGALVQGKKLATSDLWKMQVSSGITIKTVISPNHFQQIEKLKSRAEKSKWTHS